MVADQLPGNRGWDVSYKSLRSWDGWDDREGVGGKRQYRVMGPHRRDRKEKVRERRCLHLRSEKNAYSTISLAATARSLPSANRWTTLLPAALQRSCGHTGCDRTCR